MMRLHHDEKAHAKKISRPLRHDEEAREKKTKPDDFVPKKRKTRHDSYQKLPRCFRINEDHTLRDRPMFAVRLKKKSMSAKVEQKSGEQRRNKGVTSASESGASERKGHLSLSFDSHSPSAPQSQDAPGS